MNPRLRPFLFLIAVVAVSAASCLLTNHWVSCRCRIEEDAHTRLHRELGITAEQEPALDALEKRFADRRAELATRIELINQELAQAMIEARGPSPRVAEAVRKNHEAQADLQQATLDHVFEMKAALSPDQYDKLLTLTAGALRGAAH